RLELGSNSLIHCRFSFDRPSAVIKVGNRCFIGKSQLVAAELIEIEDDVIISWGVTIVDHDSHALEAKDRKKDVDSWRTDEKDWSMVKIFPVTLRRGCWIGFNASILKGVTIGQG